MGEKKGVERVLKKLNKSVEEGNYYEAHQMFRTLFFRYKGQKKYAEAKNLLYEGSLKLLQHNQKESGCDLASLLVDILIVSETQADPEWIGKLAELHKLMEISLERSAFVAAALKWSASAYTQSSTSSISPGCGHPRLHSNIAHNYWKELNFDQSRAHFLHSDDGSGCGSMLVEFHQRQCYPSEVDIVIASTVLQLLCLRQPVIAKDTFSSYTHDHPVVKSDPPYKLPLLNFIWLLLLAVEGGKQLQAFTVLCEKYQRALARDPNFNTYLDKIGQNFFGVPPPAKPKGNGLIDNLLQSLMGSGADDEESCPSTSAAAAASAPLQDNDALD